MATKRSSKGRPEGDEELTKTGIICLAYIRYLKHIRLQLQIVLFLQVFAPQERNNP